MPVHIRLAKWPSGTSFGPLLLILTCCRRPRRLEGEYGDWECLLSSRVSWLSCGKVEGEVRERKII
jgi:hypothetical protein